MGTQYFIFFQSNSFQNYQSYNLERVWCCTALKGSNSVAVGYDEGTILIKMGRDEPAVTMDVNGKLIWARHSELCQGKNLLVDEL